MNILLIVVAALAGVVYWKREQLGKATLPLLAILMIVGGVSGVYRVMNPPPKPGSLQYTTSQAQYPVQRLAKEAVAAVPSGGGVLVIQSPFQTVPMQKLREVQLAGIKKALAGTALQVVGVEPQAADASRFGMAPGLPMDLLEGYLKKYPGVVAVISLYGEPQCSPEELPKEIPPLFVQGGEDVQAVAAWIRSGRVKAALVARPITSSGAALGSTIEQQFDAAFWLLTPGNLDRVLGGATQ